MDFSFNKLANPDQAASPSSTSSVTATGARIIANSKGGIEKALYAVVGISIAICIALFAWQYYLTQQINAKKQELAVYGNSVTALPLQEIKALSARLKSVNKIVKNYPYVSNIFPILEDSIENQVTYKSLDVQTNDAGDYVLKISAEAPDYKTVARQMDVLHSDIYKKYFTKIELGALQADPTGKVSFSIQTPVLVRGINPDQLVISTTIPESDLSNLLTGSSTLIVGTSSSTQTPTP